MRIVLISGSHPRHLYFAEKIIETGTVVGMILMKREEMEPEIPIGLSENLTDIYRRHFKLRAEMEDKYFGKTNLEKLFRSIPILEVSPNELNGASTRGFIIRYKADTILSYGPDLISNSVLDLVDGNAINLHGGLSPYYKGAATMFWPFYFLEPNYVGTTLHYMIKKIDAGRVIHQTCPVLERGDCMHEVACKAIVSAADDTQTIVRMMQNGCVLRGEEQHGTGKLFLSKDWRPEHLKLIYETYEDRIVDYYLSGELNKDNNPKLIRAF